MDVSAAPGVAVAELRAGSGRGFADYTLFLDRTEVGVIEAKAHGALSGAEGQTMHYAVRAASGAPGVAEERPRFLFESNGHKTYFTDRLDPSPRSRELFCFPRPETLAEWSAHPDGTLRRRLRSAMPALAEAQLWGAQIEAIRSLEASFARGDQRALIQMATGSGKTFTAVNVAYRLLKHAGAKRILFLVDRNNLGRQTFDEFANFEPPDDARKFPALYNLQRLSDNAINPAAKVVVTTIQRLFSMLKGEPDYDAGNEEDSAFDSPTWQGEAPTVAYNAAIPPEFFDFIIIDECHRSIYDLWSQVLLYFDAFLIGLTATPVGKTLGFFNQNLVMEYGHDKAVLDGVNVDFDVYRIKTRVTEEGATIDARSEDVYVAKRDKLTRRERGVDHWRCVAFDQIATIQGGLQKSPARAPKQHHYPYLRVANVHRGRLRLDELRRFELTPEELRKLRLEPGDVLLVEGNGSRKEIGRCALWNGEVENCVHQNHIIRARLGEGVLPQYVSIFLNSPTGQLAIQQAANSTSGLYTLSVKKVKALSIALPPVAEQRAIVDAVASHVSAVDAISNDLTEKLSQANSLRQSLLHRAFTGNLAPQNANDEPAAKLLERIARERKARRR